MPLQRIVKNDWTGGTSSQPPWRRQNSEDEVISNCEPDAIFGLLDRNGTDYVSTVPGSSSLGYLSFQFRNFIIRIREGVITAEDDDGTSAVINDLTASEFDYLDDADPKSDIDIAIIGDTIFIVNKLVTVASEASDTYTVKAQVRDFEKLIDINLNPTPAEDDVYQVLISINATPAGYYKFLGGDNTQGQNWERIAAPGDADAALDKATMPHILEYNEQTGEFSFGANQEWGQRLSGNSISNKVPGFVGHVINTVAYIQGRLVLVGGGTVVTSQGGGRDVFSFWIDDVQRTVSTDPLNIDINFPEIGTPLRSAIIGNDLLIACSQGQMVLSGGQDPISNTNGNLRKLTTWPSREIPIVSNGQLCIVADENNFVHAYGYQSYVTGTQYIGKLNEHNQKLLQALQDGDEVIRRLYLLSDRLFIQSDRNTVIFRFRFDGNEFTQLAIHTWEFDDGGERLIYADQWVAHIRIVLADDSTGELRMLKYYPQIEQPAPGWDYAPALDYRQIGNAFTFIPSTNESSFNLQGRAPDANVWMISNNNGVTTCAKASSFSGQTVRFRGDWRNQDVYLGFDYLTTTTLTNLYVTPGNVITRLKEAQVSVLNSAAYYLEYGRRNGTFYRKDFGPQTLDAMQTDMSVITTRTDKLVLSGDARYYDLKLSKRNPGRVIWSALTYIVDAIVPGSKFNV